jgi:endoribonuclease Dicer
MWDTPSGTLRSVSKQRPSLTAIFSIIERNLDSVIRAPRRQRDELALYVHRPIFKHVLYLPDISSFSTNLAAFDYIFQSLDIEKDPYIISLRKKLAKTTPGTSDYTRVDQKLSRTILKRDTYTLTALQRVCTTAQEICSDIGPWAADWYICRVLDVAKASANPYETVVSDLKNTEKGYLLSILDRVVVTPVSYSDADIVDESSDKVRVLVDCLLAEKSETELNNESYSGLIFVQRRDAVLALAEVLSHHPATKDIFSIGCLVGGADSAYKTILDITRSFHKSQDATIDDFKIGDKNLIVSTAVAEEGIDIQACGSVIRWDAPTNMASWAQSRGRARRERSTFTLMFELDGAHESTVKDWEKLEREMIALYNDPSRDLKSVPEEEDLVNDEDNLEFRVETTGYG